MTFDFYGISIHEFDVAITDLLLFIESVFFAYFLYKQQSSQVLLRRLLIFLFISLSISSLLGALFHAFFPGKVTTIIGFIFWMLVANSIGITASVVWSINALISKGSKFFKTTLPFVAVYMIVFAHTMLFINYQFKTIILFYAPPMLILALVSLLKFFRKHSYAWIGLFIGVTLSFIAATIQYLKISVHPVYFNYNALYHVIQAISLAIIFLSFRLILKKFPDTENTSQKSY